MSGGFCRFPPACNLSIDTMATRKNLASTSASETAAQTAAETVAETAAQTAAQTAAAETAPETAAETAMAFDDHVARAVAMAGYTGDRAKAIIDAITADDSLYRQWENDPTVDLSLAVMMAAIATETFTVSSSTDVAWPETIKKLAAVRGIELPKRLPSTGGMPQGLLGVCGPIDLPDLSEPIKTAMRRPTTVGKLMLSIGWGSYGSVKIPAIADGRELPLELLLTIINALPQPLFKENKALKKLSSPKGATSILGTLAERLGRYVAVTDDFKIKIITEPFATDPQ